MADFLHLQEISSVTNSEVNCQRDMVITLWNFGYDKEIPSNYMLFPGNHSLINASIDDEMLSLLVFDQMPQITEFPRSKELIVGEMFFDIYRTVFRENDSLYL